MSTKAPAPLFRQVAADTPRKTPGRSAEELLHELRVHQIELELQNETLRQTQFELEASRDRYLRLYDFAPVAYLTLGSTGRVVEANLTAAKLLGVERHHLRGQRFDLFVAPHEYQRWHLLFNGDHRQAQVVELEMRRGDGWEFHGLLECRGEEPDAAQPETRVTFSDISERKRIEQALACSEESFRRLAELSPSAIFRVDAAGACTYVNQRGAVFAGWPVEDLLGEGWRRVMHPQDRERTLAQWRRDMAGWRPKPLEWRALLPDGSTRWMVSESAVELDAHGKVVGYISSIVDITDLRQEQERRRAAQEELRRRAAREEQRNTLARDVHHRIKNNLQSVAGLLRRELGKYVELKPVLDTAVSQVNAIAVVHGLQATYPGETIRLCESIRDICKTVGDLAERPVRFRIEGEQTAFRPIQVESQEAVAVALILNELVFNAVKHSPAVSQAPTVSLSADGRSAQVLIRNALASPPAFDFGGDKGLGTGLRLVRSMLPDSGAELAYELDADGSLQARLRLTSPIVAPAVPQA